MVSWATIFFFFKFVKPPAFPSDILRVRSLKELNDKELTLPYLKANVVKTQTLIFRTPVNSHETVKILLEMYIEIGGNFCQKQPICFFSF